MGILCLGPVVAFFAVPIVIGVVMMFWTWRRIMQGCRAARWPHTIATLMNVESKRTADSEGSSHEVQVRYEYCVHGQRYQGTTIHPAYGASSHEELHQRLETLLKSTGRVRAYYHPQNPATSTLSIGFYSGHLALFFGGFIFFMAGLGFLLVILSLFLGDQDVSHGIVTIDR